MHTIVGSGGGSSGRAMAFCLGRPGLNPGTDSGFFKLIISLNLFSLGVGLFQMMCNRTMRLIADSLEWFIILT